MQGRKASPWEFKPFYQPDNNDPKSYDGNNNNNSNNNKNNNNNSNNDNNNNNDTNNTSVLEIQGWYSTGYN